MKNSLIEEVKKEINEYIIESLTVNDEVLKTSEELEKYVLNNIKKAEVYTTYNGGS